VKHNDYMKTFLTIDMHAVLSLTKAFDS